MGVWKFTHNQIDAVRFYQLLLSSDLCWSCCQCRGTWRLFFTYLEKLRTGPGEDRMAWNISFIPSGTIDGLLIRFSFYGIYDICLLIEWTCWREKIEKGLIYLLYCPFQWHANSEVLVQQLYLRLPFWLLSIVIIIIIKITIIAKPFLFEKGNK